MIILLYRDRNLPSLRTILLSPWLIVGLLVVGWAPPFIDDWVHSSDPSAGFGLGWMVTVVPCSAAAIGLTLFHGAWAPLRLLRKYLD
jgi:hypothetical protein